MPYEEAILARISARAAINELRAHGVHAWEAGHAIMAATDAAPEEVATRGRDGLYGGGDVLAFLGY